MQESTEQLEELIATRLLAMIREATQTKTEPIGERQAEIEPKKQALARSTSFIKIEKNLASLGFFTPSSKRIKNVKAKTLTFTKVIDGKRIEATATIVPATIYGLPVTADQDKFLALQKIITDIHRHEGKVANPIAFTSAELLKLLEKHRNSGKNYKEVSEWLDLMSSTTIISEGTVYLAGKKAWARDRFRVFDRAVSFGKELEPGKVADKNYVWLSEWQLENINNNNLLPIDLDTYKQLKNHISKALVPLLQIWLYATRDEGAFEKLYTELCQILSTTQHRKRSYIERQLTPSFDELKTRGYIRHWAIVKTSDGKAYKIVFYHGEKFHSDRRKRLTQKREQPFAPVKPPPEQGRVEPPQPTTPLTDEQKALIKQLNLNFGVTITTAHQLVLGKFEQTKIQLETYPFRKVNPNNPAGWIIKAIEKHWSPPDAYFQHKRKQAQEQARQETQAVIATCPYCRDHEGWRFVTDPQGRSGVRRCTHDPTIETHPDLRGGANLSTQPETA